MAHVVPPCLTAIYGKRAFFGPSGSGKTTVAELIGEGVITDEIVAIRRVGEGWRVSSVPWRGSRPSADAAGLFRVRKADETSFARLSPPPRMPATPGKLSVEGEQGSEDDEHNGDGAR